MAMSYTSLTGAKTVDGSISNWLNHDAVTTVADTIVAEAEAIIYRRLRHWRMVTSVTGTMTANAVGTVNPVDYIPLPSDYLEDRVLYVTGLNYQKMSRKTMEEVIASYGYDGNGFRVPQQPYIYFNDQTNLKFDSPPDQAYPYLLYYYQQPAALSVSITNFLTTTYPRLVRVACMAQASEFMKDAGSGNYDRTYWDQLVEVEIDKAQTESDRQHRSIDVGMILQ